jgi:hypothetical protein
MKESMNRIGRGFKPEPSTESAATASQTRTLSKSTARRTSDLHLQCHQVDGCQALARNMHNKEHRLFTTTAGGEDAANGTHSTARGWVDRASPAAVGAWGRATDGGSHGTNRGAGDRSTAHLLATITTTIVGTAPPRRIYGGRVPGCFLFGRGTSSLDLMKGRTSMAVVSWQRN